MSDQRIGTRTVYRTADTLPHGATRQAVGSAHLVSERRRRRPAGAGTPTGRRGPLSVAGELAVGRPVRTGRLRTEPLDLVLLVVGEVALEPEPLRVAFVGEDVGSDAIEEPPVVADHHGAAGELEQPTLEAGQRLDVEVVGRLVEQQQVAALLEGQGEVEPVALATGEDSGRLLLVRAFEPERGDVGPRRHLD